MSNSHLSEKAIPANERLIFALDFPDNDTAKNMVETLGDSVQFYKIGLELFMGGAYFDLIDWLANEKGKKVFVDLKFYDVPETVKKAVKNLSRHNATFATVHGNENMLKAAASVKGNVKILGVTILTSFDQDDVADLGLPNIEIKDIVVSRAKRTVSAGCDGVIASGQEAAELREALGTNFLIVSPGIRPFANVDDQKRTVNVRQAFENGADYIVVGRPISQAENPKEEAEKIQKEIASLFS